MATTRLTRRQLVLGLAGGLTGWHRFGRAAPLAPALLLARDAPPDIDPTGYLVSEKFDGVRAVWDGQGLRFRSGAPAWFTDRLPRQPLDGELWLARGRFEPLCGAVRRHVPRDDEWRAISYRVFDLLDAPGTFAERSSRLHSLVVRTGAATLVAVEQAVLADRAALQQRLDEVVRAGGEGLMLHRADSRCHAGRSGALLRLKPLGDA